MTILCHNIHFSQCIYICLLFKLSLLIFQQYHTCFFHFLGDNNFEYSPLEPVLPFKSFEKMQAISLYWFPAKQQTSTLRRQNIGLFYVKFNAQFN